MSAGYVYVLSNPSMPGVLKIGRSVHGGKGRADTFYRNDTAVPTPFDLVFEMTVADAHAVEAEVHLRLAHVRLNPAREFFRCDVNQAIAMIVTSDASGLPPMLTNDDLAVDVSGCLGSMEHAHGPIMTKDGPITDAGFHALVQSIASDRRTILNFIEKSEGDRASRQDRVPPPSREWGSRLDRSELTVIDGGDVATVGGL